MNYENMSIEELNEKEKELKVEFYDNEERNEKIKEEISIIEKIKNEKNVQKESTEEVVENSVEEQKEEISLELPQIEETKEEPIQTEEVKNDLPLPQVEEDKTETPVVEETPVRPISSLFADRSTMETPTQPSVIENKEEVVLEPLIQPEETATNTDTPVEEVHQDVVSPVPAVQDMKPLTPVGIDLPNTEDKPKAVVTELVKTDTNASRAILVNEAQSVNSRKSKDMQKNIVFNNHEEKAVVTPITTDVQPAQQIETPQEVKTEAASVVETPTQTENISVEDKQKQLESMVEQLTNAKTEEEWNRINEKIAVLTKSLPQAA